MTTQSVSVGAPAYSPPESGNGTPQNRFKYLFFDLSKCFLNAVASPTCDCAAIASKVFVIALPILCFLEALLDLAAFPFIWTANKLCKPATSQPVILRAPAPLPIASVRPQPLAVTPPRLRISPPTSPQSTILTPETPQTTETSKEVQEETKQPMTNLVIVDLEIDAEFIPDAAVADPTPQQQQPQQQAEVPKPGTTEKSYTQLLVDKIPESIKNRTNAVWTAVSKTVSWPFKTAVSAGFSGGAIIRNHLPSLSFKRNQAQEID